MPRKPATKTTTTTDTSNTTATSAADEAASEPQTTEEATLEPATPVELLQALLKAYDVDPELTTRVEINGRHLRVIAKDRSLRTYRLEGWNA